MDYKEEYQKALERAKKGLPIDEVSPELKESEDERIRKELFEAIEKARVFDIDKEVADRWIAYLERLKDIDCLACDQHLKGYIAGRKVTEEEKQKGQKSAEWSEKDKDMLLSAMEYIQTYPAHRQSVVDWLKNLPNRFCLQYKQEWGEEDEEMIERICANLEYLITEAGCDSQVTGKLEKRIKWMRRLKSLRPHWKPSEEQVYSLGTVVKGYDNCTVGSVGYNLKELYEDLKKL